jgi:hypothetical protein
MKKIIIFSFLLFSVFGFGQNKIEILKDTFPTCQGIVTIDGKNSKQIYSMLKEWTAINFLSAQAHIQMDDLENGMLIIKGSSGFYITYDLQPIDFEIDYSITFNVKDNKYRFIIDVIDVTAGTPIQSLMGGTVKPSYLSYIIDKPKKKISLKIYEGIKKNKTKLITLLSNLKDQKSDNW